MEPLLDSTLVSQGMIVAASFPCGRRSSPANRRIGSETCFREAENGNTSFHHSSSGKDQITI